MRHEILPTAVRKSDCSHQLSAINYKVLQAISSQRIREGLSGSTRKRARQAHRLLPRPCRYGSTLPIVAGGGFLLACPKPTEPYRFEVLSPTAGRIGRWQTWLDGNATLPSPSREAAPSRQTHCCGQDAGKGRGAARGVSGYTHNWRRQYGGTDTDAAKELGELIQHNGKLKRLVAKAELDKNAPRE